MVKDLDWNAAMSNNEDWKVAMGSEVFRNFVKITLAEEKKEKESTPKIDEDVLLSDFDSSNVPSPLARNLDYVKSVEEIQPIVIEAVEDEDFYTLVRKATQGLKEETIIAQAARKRADELYEAEVALGLDENTYYVTSQTGNK